MKGYQEKMRKVKGRRVIGMILLLSFVLTGLLAQPPGQAPVLAQDTLQGERMQKPSSLQSPRTLRDTLPPTRRDTIRQTGFSGDTLTATVPAEEEMDHSATKAIMYALALPGLGQAYNQKYYKIPIVYAALGGVGYLIYFNNQGYRQASNDYSLDPSDINERYLRFWRRNLELSYIGLVAVYALQTIDAYVDAQLFYWDVSEDLSLRVQPSMEPLMVPSVTPVNHYGIRCRFTF